MLTSFVILVLLMLVLASLFITLPLLRPFPSQAPSQAVAQSGPRPWAAASLVAALVVMTMGLYALIGAPEALSPTPTTQAKRTTTPGLPPAVVSAEASQPLATEGIGPAQIEGMVNRLAQRLKAQPDDVAGWRRLAKSYETLRRFDDAVAAYRQVLALQPPDADVLVDYAVTLGMAQGQRLAGEPEAVLKQALDLDPRHVQALALSGSAAFERRDYVAAVAQWRALLNLIPQDDEVRASIQANIDQAKALAVR